jgi:hypothetical protein
MEYFHMNLLQSHAERCASCEPLLWNQMPASCRRGEFFEASILGDFIIKRDGYVYSVYTERGCPVRVEISSNYCATLTLLRQVHYRHLRGYFP